MRNWTTKEIVTLKRAYRGGLSPDAITELLPRHSLRGIVVRARKEGISIRPLRPTKAPRVSLTNTPSLGTIEGMNPSVICRCSVTESGELRAGREPPLPVKTIPSVNPDGDAGTRNCFGRVKRSQ
jgi:hypothetical protein